MGGSTHHSISFSVNGKHIRAAAFDPQSTLLDFLRAQGFTGAKEACAEGECGACTVLMVKPHGAGSAYIPVNSCLIFLPMAAGQEIVTVEGLAENGRLSEAQQAMAAAGGSQCGYCTPGFVVSLFAEQHRPGRQGPCDPEALGGNLCRCTGYRPIRDAAHSLGPPPESALATRLIRPAPEVQPVATDRFYRPATLAKCFELVDRYPDAMLIAGATDLGVESNLRGRLFERLISLEALQELRSFRETAEETEIGAGLTLSEIDARWQNAPPVWREWLPLFASPLIRNRATLGGNLATASPIGDSAPLLLALDARVKLASVRGERVIPLTDFFLRYRKTALQPGELLLSVLLPRCRSAARFFKTAKRRMDDISTVAACFVLDIDTHGRIERARLAFGGVAPVPLRAIEAEEALIGLHWNDGAVYRAQDVLARTLHPISDHRGSAAYRVALAQKLFEKFWWEQTEVAA